MRASRWMTVLAPLMGLALLAAGCGTGDDTADVQPTDAVTTPADDGAEDAPTDEATAAPTATDGEAVAGDAELCSGEFTGITAPDDFRVGLVTDIGSVDDGTFNQFAYEGMLAAAECFGFADRIDVIETSSEADYQQNISTILANEPDVVVTVGFLIAEATLQFAQENPEVRFIGVDQFQEEFPDNYVGILAREDQGGYLAGTMAALLTETGVIGVVAGREDVPPVVRFVNAYDIAATRLNPDIQVLAVYHESFGDPAAGASTAEQMLGEGADVIMGAGGPTGSGGIRAAAEQGAWVIGVDQDEYFTTFGGGTTPGADRLVTSALKRIDVGVFTLIADAISGQFSGGIFTLTAENGGIDFAPPHDADVPQAVIDQVSEVLRGLADGSIDTGVDPITGEKLEG